MDRLNIDDAQFIDRTVDPIGYQKGPECFHIEPASRSILLTEVGWIKSMALEVTQLGNELAALA